MNLESIETGLKWLAVSEILLWGFALWTAFEFLGMLRREREK